MASLLGEIGAKPRSKQVVPILVTTVLNGVGGFAAERLEGLAKQWFPKNPTAPPLVLTIGSFALRLGFSGTGNMQAAMREIAAGIAGWTGDDLIGQVIDALGWGVQDFKLNIPYAVGDKVRYEGKTYKVNSTISAGSGAVPGLDSRFVAAQGIDPADLHEVTSAILNNEKLLRMLTQAQAAIFAPKLEELARTTNGVIELNEATRPKIVAELSGALREVAQTFHSMVG